MIHIYIRTYTHHVTWCGYEYVLVTCIYECLWIWTKGGTGEISHIHAGRKPQTYIQSISTISPAGGWRTKNKGISISLQDMVFHLKCPTTHSPLAIWCYLFVLYFLVMFECCWACWFWPTWLASLNFHAVGDSYGITCPVSNCWGPSTGFAGYSNAFNPKCKHFLQFVPLFWKGIRGTVEVREPKILVGDDNHQSQEVEDTPWINRVFKDSQQIIKK